MRMMLTMMAIGAIACTACSPGGSDRSSGSGQGGLSAAECRAVVDKSRELSGMPADVFVEAAEQSVQKCAAAGTLTRDKYDCAMRATSSAELQACRIDDFS